jgi:hypothetical protein
MVPKFSGVSAAGYSLLRIWERAFAVFGDETVDPRGHNGQRYRAELEHRIVMVTTALPFKCGKRDTFKFRRVQFSETYNAIEIENRVSPQ